MALSNLTSGLGKKKSSSHRADKKLTLNSRYQATEFTNASRTLLANIRFAGLDNPIKVVTVTSASMDDGKTTVSINLAVAAATGGDRVLLVDCDMRRRRIANIMDVHPQYGLVAAISNQVQINDAIEQTSYENLYFMDCEADIPSPPDILSSKRFAAMVNFLKDQFDLVIFDTPPLESFIDAALVGHVADGVVIAVRERKTKRTALASALAQLEAANARVLGAVLNDVEQTSGSYYYEYYYRENHRKARHGGHGR